MGMNDPATLWTLCGSSLLASTLLPGGSEAVLVLAALVIALGKGLRYALLLLPFTQT